jgi:hypothetical protein
MRGDVFKALPLEETSGNIRNLPEKRASPLNPSWIRRLSKEL